MWSALCENKSYAGAWYLAPFWHAAVGRADPKLRSTDRRHPEVLRTGPWTVGRRATLHASTPEARGAPACARSVVRRGNRAAPTKNVEVARVSKTSALPAGDWARRVASPRTEAPPATERTPSAEGSLAVIAATPAKPAAAAGRPAVMDAAYATTDRRCASPKGHPAQVWTVSARPGCAPIAEATVNNAAITSFAPAAFAARRKSSAPRSAAAKVSPAAPETLAWRAAARLPTERPPMNASRSAKPALESRECARPTGLARAVGDSGKDAARFYRTLPPDRDTVPLPWSTASRLLVRRL